MWNAGLLDVLLPRSCGGCGRADTAWCPRCAGALRVVVSGGRARVAGVLDAPVGLPPVHVVGAYGGVLRSAVLAYKERGRADLAVVLGPLLACAVRSAVAGSRGPVVIVAVPASRAGRRARGRDHLAALVRAEDGLPPPYALLGWRRRVADQAGLSATQRAANLTGALVARGRWPHDAAALLVDDVVTTGATLAEAARACQVAGIPVAGVAALAATRLRPAALAPR